VQQAVSDFWQKLWNMDLARTTICDFEEYQDSNMEDGTIHIYIGIQKNI
jgi:predicted transcriptional regulator YdeE